MYGIYYNDLFDALIIAKKTIENATIEIHEQEKLTLIKGQDQGIIGANVFEVSKDLHVKNAFNTFNDEVISYLKNRLINFDFSYQPQFVIGHVEKCEPIEGTHLHLCEVDLKNKKTQIVCGAKNIEQGQNVVVALPYSWMPDGTQILPSKLRGYDSNGMICSQKELAIDDDRFNREGIIVLNKNFANKIGEDFFKQ